MKKLILGFGLALGVAFGIAAVFPDPTLNSYVGNFSGNAAGITNLTAFLSTPNTWTAPQTFGGGILGLMTNGAVTNASGSRVAYMTDVGSGVAVTASGSAVATTNVGVVNIAVTTDAGLGSNNVFTSSTNNLGTDASAVNFWGGGSHITALNATQLTSGTVPIGRLYTTFAGYAISDSSANLAAALTDKTGTGSAVFGTAPTMAMATFTGTNTMDSLSASNVALIGITTANLTTARVGTLKYDSDCITPSGTVGSTVWYDGTNWRLAGYNIKVTTDTPTFIINCVEALNSFSTRQNVFVVQPNLVNVPNGGSVGALYFANSGGSGTGSGANLLLNSTHGPYVQLTTGTTTTGYYYSSGPLTLAIAASAYNACGEAVYVPQASTVTDKYFAFHGLSSTSSQTYPTEGAFFLYDCNTNQNSFNTYVAGLSGANKVITNNWACVCAHSSTYTYADSGVVVSFSGTTPNRLGVVYTNGAAQFWVNGSLVQTITANQPTANLYTLVSSCVKTAGTTSVYLAENSPWTFDGHAIRTYP